MAKGVRGGKYRYASCNRIFFDNRLVFGFLDNSASLLYASDCELGLEPIFSQFPVNERVQLDVVPDAFFPGGINTILYSFSVDFDGFQNGIIERNFDVDCCPIQHSYNRGMVEFKSCSL